MIKTKDLGDGIIAKITNIEELKKISSINGFLIGGASQNSKNFIDIIKKTIN